MDENDFSCSREQQPQIEEIGKRGSEIRITLEEVLANLEEQFDFND